MHSFKRYFVLLLMIFSSMVFASSSQLILKQRTLLLQKQNIELQNSLAHFSEGNIETENELKKRQMALGMQRDMYALALKLALSERQFFLLNQQQANKKLSGLTTQTPYIDLQHTIKYNSEMSQYAFSEMQWIEKNISLVEQLMEKNKASMRQLQLTQLRYHRKNEALKLKARIKQLRQMNHEALSDDMGQLSTLEKGDNQTLLADEAQRSLDNLDGLLRRQEIEKLQLTIKLNFSDYLRIRSGTLITLEKLILRLNELELRTNSGTKMLQTILLTQNKIALAWQNKLLDPKHNKRFSAHLARQNNEIKTLIKAFKQLLNLVDEHLFDYEKERAQLLKQRKGLLKDTVAQGRQMFHEFIKLPKATGVYAYGLYGRVNDFARSLLPWQQLFALAGLILMIFIWAVGKKQQSHFIEKEKALVGEHHVYSVFGHLISRNWGALCLLGGLCSLFTMSHISPLSYRLILVIFSVWFVFRAIISITRLALLESLSNVDGLDVHLYHRLRLTFVLGGVITTAMVLSHYLHMHYLVLELLDRLFMIFLFTVSLVLLKGHNVLLTLIHNHMKPKKFYTKRALDLFTLLVPMALLVNGMLGVLGYVPLAWDISYYQAIIVVVVITYVVLRGILLDALEKVSESMIRRLNNGWLWTEAFLKPFHKALLYFLLLALVAVVFRLYGWDDRSQVVRDIWLVWQFKLLDLSRISISVKSLIHFLIMSTFLLWLARWSREFCYRWLYHNVLDQGLRKSLSIFTQYAMLTIGGIVSLTVLGVDISGISMILGGLAVGVGFGLRDFANNIVGGLVLLIERPVKEGDLVSFDAVEGKVTHIGLRSMRIKSWDNYEVVMPNADLFIKPFTNWTHKDSVVRTVVAIKVNRYDSPLKVQGLVLDVLKIIPEVLDEPETQVFLKEIDEALIELEVRYYINVEQHARVEVRSEVLFAIMAQFKAAGIKSPIPPIQIEKSDNDRT